MERMEPTTSTNGMETEEPKQELFSTESSSEIGKMDICGEDHRMLVTSECVRSSEDCSNFVPSLNETEKSVVDHLNAKSDDPIKLEPLEPVLKPHTLTERIIVEESSPLSVTTTVVISDQTPEQFSLSTNNLSLIRSQQQQQQLNGDIDVRTTERKEIKDSCDEVKTEKTSSTATTSTTSTTTAAAATTKMTNGHGHHSHDKKSHHRTTESGTSEKTHHSSSSSSSRHRDRDRDRDRDRHRPKRANIGIQCRRDKTLENTVGFSSSATTTEGATTTTATSTATTTTGKTSADVATTDFSSGSEFVCSPRFAGFSMANPCYNLSGKYKHGSLMRVETYPNGGGKVLHLWQDEIANFSEQEQDLVARDFVKVKL